MVLHNNSGVFALDPSYEFTKAGGSANTCHILETDLVSAVLHQMVNNIHIIIDRMNRRVCY